VNYNKLSNLDCERAIRTLRIAASQRVGIDLAHEIARETFPELFERRAELAETEGLDRLERFETVAAALKFLASEKVRENPSLTFGDALAAIYVEFPELLALRDGLLLEARWALAA
jgi:hypothetical protein